MSRKYGFPVVVVLVSVSICAAILFGLAPHPVLPGTHRQSGLQPVLYASIVPTIGKATDSTGSPTSATSPAPKTASPKSTAVTVVPAGMTPHIVAKGEGVASLIHAYLPVTKYMTGSELEAALRAANGGRKGNNLKPGETILIPGVEPQPLVEKPIPVPKTFDVRAIYLTGIMAGSAKGLELVREWKQLGGNSVVFDLKDSDGSVSVPFDNPLAPKTTPSIRNLAKYVRYLHSLGFHVIGRIAIFRDEYLVTHHPELAVQSRRSGGAWRENGKLVWTDPSHQEVQKYNIALALFGAKSGVDEIQFDYVRFPAEGDQKDAVFAFEKSHPKWQRSDAIDDFLDKSYSQIHAQGVLFSLDVFGVMAWQRSVDLSHTGQDIVQMAKRCDVLSPMIYPSHFFGMDGYKEPGDAPEHFIGESMDRFALITKDSGVVLRPWLQAFGWRTKTYSPDYIRTQVSVARSKGGLGFLFWNARNDYSKPFAAMPEMRAKPDRYFGSAKGTRPVTNPDQHASGI